MKPWMLLAFALALILAACNAGRDETVIFSCVAEADATPGSARRVDFRYEDRFLFVRNDAGGADNVCSQTGTRLCEISLTGDSLTLRQEIDTPYCGWRQMARTTLDIDRRTGVFQFMQEGCDPGTDLRLTGLCEMSRPE
ncbi:hypothetical protein [Hyphomonas sp. BRH_c22]|uniref:hypothetical protein n=1 Tax=Hyphomonas sp. BRH_c22 TaxID=1629710 RepID=UPI000A5771EF|nr:hypothetical protein [Hyphomonas sp. BRH_c22]